MSMLLPAWKESTMLLFLSASSGTEELEGFASQFHYRAQGSLEVSNSILANSQLENNVWKENHA